MQIGWVKLWRKIEDHPIMQDPNAMLVFIDLLVSADRRTGQVVTGRYMRSLKLNMKPSTWRDALMRLKRWEMADIKADSTKSIISICNWSKYQATDDREADYVSDSNPTATRQQPDTIQEIKNKELRNKDRERGVVVANAPTPAQKAKAFFEVPESQEPFKQKWLNKNLKPQFVNAEFEKFTAYWTEPNPSGTKQLWQLRKTFDIARRLDTWFRNCEERMGKLPRVEKVWEPPPDNREGLRRYDEMKSDLLGNMGT